MRRMCRYFTHFHSELFLYGAWLSSRRRRRRLPPSSPAFQFRSSGRCRKGTFLFLSTPANLEDPRFSMTISDGGNTAKHPPTQFDFQSMDCRISFSNILFSLSLSSLRKVESFPCEKLHDTREGNIVSHYPPSIIRFRVFVYSPFSRRGESVNDVVERLSTIKNLAGLSGDCRLRTPLMNEDPINSVIAS